MAAATRLFSLARMSTATTGTGTITLGSAVSGFLSFSAAGVSDGDIVGYGIRDGSNSEVGYGTYTSSGTTLTRTVIKSTNSDSAISLSGAAQVFIAPAHTHYANVDSSGRFIFGHTATIDTKRAASTITASMQQVGTSVATAAVLRTQWSADANGPNLLLGKSRGASAGTFTVVQSGDVLGALSWAGADGTDFAEGAYIQAAVDGTPGAGDMPTRLTFGTSADGAESPTERARIDSSGRFLFGHTATIDTKRATSAITAAFQQTGVSTAAAASLRTQWSADAVGPNLLFGKSRGASAGTFTVVQSDDVLGALSWAGADGTDFAEAAYIHAAVDGTPGAGDMPGRLVFATSADGAESPTERMRIESNGRVGIGTAGAANALLDVRGTVIFNEAGGDFDVRMEGDNDANLFFLDASTDAICIGTTTQRGILSLDVGMSTQNGISILDENNQSAAGYVAFRNAAGTAIGSINRSGSSDAVVYNTTSDRRKKRDIAPTTINALAMINKLSVCDFGFISDPHGPLTVGFIAQDVYEVFPCAVTTSGDNGVDPLDDEADPWSMDYGRITPLLVKAIQELNAKVDGYGNN